MNIPIDTMTHKIKNASLIVAPSIINARLIIRIPDTVNSTNTGFQKDALSSLSVQCPCIARPNNTAVEIVPINIKIPNIIPI